MTTSASDRFRPVASWILNFWIICSSVLKRVLCMPFWYVILASSVKKNRGTGDKSNVNLYGIGMHMEKPSLKMMLNTTINSTCKEFSQACYFSGDSKNSRMDLISSRSWLTSDSKAIARCSAVLLRSSASFKSEARSISRVLIFN